MTDGKKNEPKRIDRWNDFDIDLVNNWTKNLLFESPFCLDQDLELKPLEFFLIEFEDEAKKILEENGLYSEELVEAWRTPSDVKDFSRLYPQRKDSPSLFSPLLTSMALQNVAYVFLCVHRVRKDILNGDAEQTAIDMLRLCFATVSANLHEMIVRGIKAKTAPARGGKKEKKVPAFNLLVRYAWQNSKRKTCLSMWEFLIRKLEAGDIGGRYIIEGCDFVYEKKNNRITLYFSDERKRPRDIGFRSFERYVNSLKKGLKK